MTRAERLPMLMGVAYSFAMRSTCSRRQVGALLVRNNRVISTGYNGAPSGMSHCNHMMNEEMPFGCKNVVHAEANTIAFAARNGIATANSTLITTLSPCVDCARLAINAGITDVIYHQRYRDVSGLEILSEGGVSWWSVTPVVPRVPSA